MNIKNFVKASMAFLVLLCNVIKSEGQLITAAEYFVNTDPGVGNGTPILFVPGITVNTNFSIPTSGLTQGFNQLFIRVQDQGNNWSISEERTFFIDNSLRFLLPTLTAAEYFMDTDPGAGNGSPLTISNGDTVSTLVNINTTGLSSGFHQLFLRVKDQDNNWSITEERTFYINGMLSKVLPPIVAAEYYVDKDSGVGNNTPVPVLKGTTVDTNFNFATTTLPLGAHTINVRVKDSTGSWSLVESLPFSVAGSPLPVTLLRFGLTCAGSNVVLSWQTTSETNSGLFEIQKNNNGSADWNTIGTVNAAGNSTILQDYRFTDVKGEGLSLYRLREVDRDGKFTYSATITSDCALSGVQLHVYPVPAKDRVYLLIDMNEPDLVNILLLDVNGKIIQQVNSTLQKGANNLSLNIAGLAAGQYFLKVQGTQLMEVEKVIIMR